MTDDLVKRLRGDWFGYDVSLKAIDAMDEAADRIEQLTGEVQRWQGMFDEKHNLMLEHKARAEVAEAERDRLRIALTDAESYLGKGLDKMAYNILRAALKGETP